MVEVRVGRALDWSAVWFSWSSPIQLQRFWYKVPHEWRCFIDQQSSVTVVFNKHWYHLVLLWVWWEKRYS